MSAEGGGWGCGWGDGREDEQGWGGRKERGEAWLEKTDYAW